MEEKQNLADWTYQKFKASLTAKEPIAREWNKYIDAYNGKRPGAKVDYKSDLKTNFVFSTIESIRPIMADEEPCVDVLPRNQEGVESADVITKCLQYEFDREGMRTKILKALTPCLQLGTAVFFIPWDANAGKDGEVRCILVNPFNIFPDPMATCVDDAEYIIYATYKHVNQLKKLFPKHAEKLEGGDVKHKELVGDIEATKTAVDTQVLVLETWCRDYTYIDVEERDENGVITKKKVRQFPNGRVITTAPELGIVLDDKKNPYKDGKFPFVIMKDHDIPFQFWGKGEIENILSPQEYIDELTNQIIDNAKTTANMQWIIDNNAGIGVGKLTNRPGLVIRKTPGTEVRRDAPPPMPGYVRETIEVLKTDIETISGIHDVTQGRRPGGIQAGNAIMALQEAGQARIRIKIKLMEEALSEVLRMWYSRMKQFWTMKRWVRIVDDEGNFQFLEVNKDNFQHEYDISIKSGSTMAKNKNGLLDLYIRLAQTQAEDGLPMLDRESVLSCTPLPNKREILKKFEGIKTDQMQQQMEQMQQAYEEQKMMLEQQIEQLNQMVQEVGKGVQEVTKEVERIEEEHEKIKLEERLTDAKSVGFEQGVAEIQNKITRLLEENEEEENVLPNGMTDEETLGMQTSIDDELIELLNNLPQEELMAIMEQNPELIDLIQAQGMPQEEAPQMMPQNENELNVIQ